VERTKSERLIVDKHCRIPGFDNAFVIGDISAFDLSPDNENSNFAPQLAQMAVKEARFAADNIIRSMRGLRIEERITHLVTRNLAEESFRQWA
jgi:NADH dehydrogenase FAD-containing subunit